MAWAIGSSPSWPALTWKERTAERVALLVGCSEEVAASCLRRLRGRMLVEVDGCRPTGWLRTHRGDVVLEHQP